jgi:putative alpha-1,2-mannosidase
VEILKIHLALINGVEFTEGSAWHYTWSVLHDPQGLINLMGGKDNYVKKNG